MNAPQKALGIMKTNQTKTHHLLLCPNKQVFFHELMSSAKTAPQALSILLSKKLTRAGEASALQLGFQ